MQRNIFFILLCIFFISKNSLANYESVITNIKIHTLEYCFENSTRELKKNNATILKHVFETVKQYKHTNNKIVYYLIEEIGDYYTRTYQYREAITHYKTAIDYWEKKKNRKKTAFLYNKIGKNRTRLFNYTIAEFNFNNALKIFTKQKDSAAIAYTYNSLAKAYQYNNKTKEAGIFFKKALNIYLETNDIKGLIYTYNSLGDFHSSQNKSYSAQKEYTKAIKINKDNFKFKIYSYNKLSYTYINLKKHNLALELQKKAYKLSDSINYSKGMAAASIAQAKLFMKSFRYSKALILAAREINKKNSDSSNTAKCSFLMGTLFHIMQNNEDSIKEFKYALKLFLKTNNKEYAAKSYIEIARILDQEDKIDESKKYYNKALEILKTLNNKNDIANCTMNKGHLLIKTNKIEAENLINKAKQTFYNTNNKEGVAKCLYSLGVLQSSNKNYKIANYYLLESLIISSKQELKHITLNTYLQLYKNTKHCNQSKKSLYYYEKYVDLKDNIIKLKTQLKIGWTQEQEKIKKNTLITKKLKKDLEEEELKVTKGTNTSILLGIIIIFTCIFGFIIYKMNLRLKKSNNNLNSEIIEKNKARILLEQHKNHLEDTVIQRTQELIKAKNKAEQADDLKSKFLSNMSHELRTPLNAILGFSQLLTTETTLSKQEEYINIIHENNNILLDTVDDIINISLIETKQFKLEINNCCVNKLCTDIAKNIQEKINRSNKNIELLVNNTNTKESIIKTDKKKLIEVMYNLLENALKFTNKGKIEFGYRLKTNKIIFFVSDSGIGINKYELKIIFDQFRQASNNKVQHGGTGLGLSISKSIIELLGGNIKVRSTRDKGSIFIFHIPL